LCDEVFEEVKGHKTSNAGSFYTKIKMQKYIFLLQRQGVGDFSAFVFSHLSASKNFCTSV